MIKHAGIRLIIFIFSTISIQFLGLSSLFGQEQSQPPTDYNVQRNVQNKVESSSIHEEQSQKSDIELADNSMRELSVDEIMNITTGCYSAEKIND